MDQQTYQTVFAVKSVLEWAFQVTIPDEIMGWLTAQVQASWNNGDPSEQQLIAYLVQLAVAASSMQEPALSLARNEVATSLRKEFAQVRFNDLGYTLIAIRGILETLRPGCTHLPAVLAAAAQASAMASGAPGATTPEAPAAPVPMPVPTSVPTAVPSPVPSMGAPLPGAASAQAYGGFVPPPAQAAMPNLQTLLSPPPPTFTPLGAQSYGAGAPAQGMAPMNPMLREQMEMAAAQEEVQRQTQAIMFRSNLSKTFHDATMQIINNMR